MSSADGLQRKSVSGPSRVERRSHRQLPQSLGGPATASRDEKWRHAGLQGGHVGTCGSACYDLLPATVYALSSSSVPISPSLNSLNSQASGWSVLQDWKQLLRVATQRRVQDDQRHALTAQRDVRWGWRPSGGQAPEMTRAARRVGLVCSSLYRY
ncbi:uncharacterized protein TrAFT101_010838 [Trichoderma asperellum]|uniref:uncharacterized protein n=1 Tax=Trichoderma asperellum TaxID=101201 RepID=UPI0033209332|nr:hypothetical protein TrAFT101_010838 [Trichoderma asperellum]